MADRSKEDPFGAPASAEEATVTETEPEQPVEETTEPVAEVPTPAPVRVKPVGDEDLTIEVAVKGTLVEISVPTDGATVDADQAEALKLVPSVEVVE